MGQASARGREDGDGVPDSVEPIIVGDIRLGLATVELPGRFQVMPGRPSVIFDVAHNPQAARELARWLVARLGLDVELEIVAMAGYHTLLVAGLVPKSWIPCSAGVSCADQKLEIINGIQIPWLSLVAFFIITLLLTFFLRRTPK